MVRGKQIRPSSVAQARGRLGGAGQICHQKSGENSIPLGGGPHPGQELLDLVYGLIGVDPRYVIRAGKFHERRSWDPFGYIPPLLYVRVWVAGSMHDERW